MIPAGMIFIVIGLIGLYFLANKEEKRERFPGTAGELIYIVGGMGYMLLMVIYVLCIIAGGLVTLIGLIAKFI